MRPRLGAVGDEGGLGAHSRRRRCGGILTVRWRNTPSSVEVEVALDDEVQRATRCPTSRPSCWSAGGARRTRAWRQRQPRRLDVVRPTSSRGRGGSRRPCGAVGTALPRARRGSGPSSSASARVNGPWRKSSGYVGACRHSASLRTSALEHLLTALWRSRARVAVDDQRSRRCAARQRPQRWARRIRGSGLTRSPPLGRDGQLDARSGGPADFRRPNAPHAPHAAAGRARSAPAADERDDPEHRGGAGGEGGLRGGGSATRRAAVRRPLPRRGRSAGPRRSARRPGPRLAGGAGLGRGVGPGGGETTTREK